MNIARDEVHLYFVKSLSRYRTFLPSVTYGRWEFSNLQRASVFTGTCSMVAASAGVRSVGISECVAFVFMVLACRNQRRYR